MLPERPLHIALLLALLLPLVIQADPGKKAWDQGNYPGALQYYQKRLDNGGKDNQALQYNAGTALQKLDKDDEATTWYQRSLQSTDPLLKSQAHYNLARLYEKKKDMKNALSNLQSAILLNPQDMNAKAAYERLTREMQQQKQQQQSKQDQNQDKKKDQEQQQQQQKSDQDKEDQQKKQSQEEQQQEQQNPQQQQAMQKDAKMSESKDDMSRDQVENILNAMRERELESMKKLLKEQTKAGNIKRSKDW